MNKFMHRNGNKYRAIYKYVTSLSDFHFTDVFSEIIRDILVANLIDKLF